MEPSTNKLTMPVAIVLAGVLVAGAIVLSKSVYPNYGKTNENADSKKSEEIKIRPVTEADHILGNPNADIIIVEYSDTECPFCKQFHKTMQTIMAEYGKDGKVAWVYRHFPIAQLHPKAAKEAEATECAALLGGKSAFWDYINRLYEITPSNDGLDPAKLVDIAVELKLDKQAFVSCLESGKYTEKIKKDYEEAVTAGARGTPHSIILTKNGDKLPLEGAQPLPAVKSIIEGLLKGR